MSSMSASTRRLTASLVFCALVMTSGGAMAACSQADATGIWQIFSQGYQRGFEPYWMRCVIFVNPNGTFSNRSKCTTMEGRDVAGTGQIKLVSATACTFNGFIQGGGMRNQIVQTVMNRSKDHLEGVGLFAGGNFVFSGTKR